MSPKTFHCPYAPRGQDRCPQWRCDCFIETHPEDPFGMHPEDFVVGTPSPTEPSAP